MSKAAYISDIADLRTALDSMVAAEDAMIAEVISEDTVEMTYAQQTKASKAGVSGRGGATSMPGQWLLNQLNALVVTYETWSTRWT